MIFTIFNTQVKDADFYKHNDSTWLIFTSKKKWVFELSKEGTLWYNYYFFNNFFELLSLDVIENQNYITEWVEDTIQNGVKYTRNRKIEFRNFVEDTIQNGVKYTHLGGKDRKIGEIKDIIQNGVKDIVGIMNEQRVGLDDTIQNWVKETKMEEHHRLREVVQTVKNGVKETNPHFLEILNPINFEPVIKEMKRMNEVNIILEKSIKEVKELPDKSGELRGYGDYYAHQQNKTYAHDDIISDVIHDGIKETKYCELHSAMSAEHIIRDGIKETWGYTQQPPTRVNEVIRGGVKETNWRRVDNHPTYLDNIIKSSN
jgi:hypothetical protein